MKFAELKKKVAAGELATFYRLTGEDEYLKNSAVGILKNLVTLPELNAVTLEAPTSQALRDALTSVPMMSEKRLVVADKLTEVDALAAYASAPSHSSILVLTGQPEAKRGGKKESKREEAVREFLTAAVEIDCSPLDERTIFAWMSARTRKYNVEVERAAASLLIEYCRSDMSRISGEFDKLASYRMGGTVIEEDVRSLVKPELEFAVWQLSKAVAAGNAAGALEIFGSFDEDSKKPEVLFGAIYSHFRKLFYSLTEDDAALKSGLGMKENTLYAVRREAGKFGAERLKRLLLSLSQLDEDMKNGTVPREIASEMLVLKTVSEI